MSLESWKAEFYPVDASKVSEADALAHSLKKWEGLRKENLERHGCVVDGPYVRVNEVSDDASLAINDKTCACCVHWYEESTGCSRCPLSVIRGRPCDEIPEEDEIQDDYEEESPYVEFTYGEQNPEPMIQLIQLAIERQEKK